MVKLTFKIIYVIHIIKKSSNKLRKIKLFLKKIKINKPLLLTKNLCKIEKYVNIAKKNYVLIQQELIMKKLLEKNIQTATHYVPLHSSKAGLRYCKVSGSLLRTNNIANSIIRLPIWIGLSIKQQEYIVESIEKVFKSNF